MHTERFGFRRAHCLEVPDGVVDDAGANLHETMIQAGKAYLSKVPVEVEVAIVET